MCYWRRRRRRGGPDQAGRSSNATPQVHLRGCCTITVFSGTHADVTCSFAGGVATGSAVRVVGHLLVHTDAVQSVRVQNVFHSEAKVYIQYNPNFPLLQGVELCILRRISRNGTATARRTAHVRHDRAHRRDGTRGEIIMLCGAQVTTWMKKTCMFDLITNRASNSRRQGLARGVNKRPCMSCRKNGVQQAVRRPCDRDISHKSFRSPRRSVPCPRQHALRLSVNMQGRLLSS
jgi:hypothetical protein